MPAADKLEPKRGLTSRGLLGTHGYLGTQLGHSQWEGGGLHTGQSTMGHVPGSYTASAALITMPRDLEVPQTSPPVILFSFSFFSS